jgi:hypothetical protein
MSIMIQEFLCARCQMHSCRRLSTRDLPRQQSAPLGRYRILMGSATVKVSSELEGRRVSKMVRGNTNQQLFSMTRRLLLTQINMNAYKEWLYESDSDGGAGSSKTKRDILSARGSNIFVYSVLAVLEVVHGLHDFCVPDLPRVFTCVIIWYVSNMSWYVISVFADRWFPMLVSCTPAMISTKLLGFSLFVSMS